MIVPMPCDKYSVRLCERGELLELSDCFFELFFKVVPAGGSDFTFSEERHDDLSFWLLGVLAFASVGLPGTSGFLQLAGRQETASLMVRGVWLTLYQFCVAGFR